MKRIYLAFIEQQSYDNKEKLEMRSAFIWAFCLFLVESNWGHEGVELEKNNQKMNLKRLPDTQS